MNIKQKDTTTFFLDLTNFNIDFDKKNDRGYLFNGFNSHFEDLEYNNYLHKSFVKFESEVKDNTLNVEKTEDKERYFSFLSIRIEDIINGIKTKFIPTEITDDKDLNGFFYFQSEEYDWDFTPIDTLLMLKDEVNEITNLRDTQLKYADLAKEKITELVEIYSKTSTKRSKMQQKLTLNDAGRSILTEDQICLLFSVMRDCSIIHNRANDTNFAIAISRITGFSEEKLRQTISRKNVDDIAYDSSNRTTVKEALDSVRNRIDKYER